MPINNVRNQKNNLGRRAYHFSLDIIDFCQGIPTSSIGRIICSQLLRSATSIGANIIEAKCASSKKEFAKFYRIALKSANESQYWLCLLRDGNIKVDNDKISKLLSELDEICRILAKSLLTMKKSLNS